MFKPQHILTLIVLFSAANLAAQRFPSARWERADIRAETIAARRIMPDRYITFRRDPGVQPHEFIREGEIILPTPAGSLERYRVTRSDVIAPESASQFSYMCSYDLRGIDDRFAAGKLDVNQNGVHAMVFSPRGDFFIDPVTTTSGEFVICYYRKDYNKKTLSSETDAIERQSPHLRKSGRALAPCIGSTVVRFRLAIACTYKYASLATGKATPAIGDIFAKIVVTVNRVNGVLERDAGIRLVLVPTTTAALCVSETTDLFPNQTNMFAMIQRSQRVLDSIIGPENYDIGHTFSGSGGGLAVIGSLCVPNVKAQGVTGHNAPAGDPFDIDYVAHEIGHQLGAHHTFNSVSGHCSNNRSQVTAVEPGSGVTIMGYAGLCGTDNLAGNSIPYLHAASSDEIVHFAGIVKGEGCGVQEITQNTPPVVKPLPKVHFIPRGTPFVLTGEAHDPDGDVLTFSWEEITTGTSAAPWNADVRPYFRSYAPDTVAVRHFPSTHVVRNGELTGTPGEYLSAKEQRLAFRLTARDNRIGGGGLCSDSTIVQLCAAGPFSVMAPNSGTLWEQGSDQLICWDVNNSNAVPVLCAKVNISLSTDDGMSYTQLKTDTDNDGFEKVTLPNLTQSQTACRIKVEAADNIFYAISPRFRITTEILTSTAMQESEPLRVVVLPNPFGDHLTIWVESQQPTAADLTDATGRLLQSFQLNQGANELNSESLLPGIYFLRLPQFSGRAVARMVKQ